MVKHEPGWVLAVMIPLYAAFLYCGYFYLIPLYEIGYISLVAVFMVMGVAIITLSIVQAVIKRTGKGVARTLYGSWLVPEDPKAD
jgi:hypothetical protein